MAISIPTLVSLAGEANVFDYGAKGDGVTDDTTAFNNALANNQNVRYQGFRRNGSLAQYNINGQVNIPIFGSLTGPNRGLLATPGNKFYGTDSSSTLTSSFLTNPNTVPGLLLITGNSGNSSAANSPFVINSDATFQCGAAYYPNQPQLLTSSSAPVAYPPFASMPVGVNATFRNFGVINPYQLLNANGMWRPTITDVISQPYYSGIFVDNCYDCARIDRVHFETFWDAKEQSAGYFYQPWSNANGTAFQINRCDLLQAIDIFAYGYKTGLNLNSTDGTAANGPWATFTNAHFDLCTSPIIVAKTQNYGVNFVNCMITGGSGTSVTVLSTNSGTLNFGNCLFVSNGVGLYLQGSGETVVTGCVFDPASGAGSSAILHSGGGLLATGNNFKGNTVQYSNSGVPLWVIMTGNRCKTAVSITNTVGNGVLPTANFNVPYNFAY